MANSLVRYDAMCRAIEAAYDVDEVKAIRDKAAALEYYARMALDEEQERRCHHIRLRAERRAGELLKTRKRPHGNQYGTSSDDDAPKLSDLDITLNQSSAWQRLAKVSEKDFEAALAQDEAGDGDALNKIIVKTKAREGSIPRSPVNPDATWLWGQLREFERHGFDQDPVVTMHTATSHMRDDVRRLVPIVCAWLQRLIDEEWEIIDDGR
jgi:hypothetical protein